MLKPRSEADFLFLSKFKVETGMSVHTSLKSAQQALPNSFIEFEVFILFNFDVDYPLKGLIETKIFENYL